MCLLTNLKNPIVASEDFKCYKLLVKQLDGTYKTPITNVKVKLNCTFRAAVSNKGINNGIFTIVGSGFIHAFTSLKKNITKYDERFIVFKCICKKGTEYYIDKELREVCAKELYITDIVYKGDTDDSINLEEFSKMIQPIINNVDNKISIGDYFLIDKSFVHVKDYNGEKEVIGIVGNITDEEIYIISTKEYKSETLIKSHIRKRYIKNGWFIPSLEEIRDSIMSNNFIINISLYLLSKKVIFADGNFLVRSYYGNGYMKRYHSFDNPLLRLFYKVKL